MFCNALRPLDRIELNGESASAGLREHHGRSSDPTHADVFGSVDEEADTEDEDDEMEVGPWDSVFWVSRQLSDIICQLGQLSARTTVSSDNCQLGQLSARTSVSPDNCQTGQLSGEQLSD